MAAKYLASLKCFIPAAYICKDGIELPLFVHLRKATILTANHSYCDLVYEITKRIPKGRVTTYGAIADYLALGSARMVGYALRQLPSGLGIPAHRVVNHKGELSGRHSFVPPSAMQQRLEAEGVAVAHDKVVGFKEIFWHPKELDHVY